MIDRFFDLESRLPSWLRPTWRGMTFLLGIGTGKTGKLFVLALLAILLVMDGGVTGAILFLKLLGTALVAGGVAGTIMGLVEPIERWGRSGIWLRWTLSIFGYILTFGFVGPAGPFSLHDRAFFPLAGGLSALAAVGVMFLDERRPGRLSPRRHRVQQGRDRMWASAGRARTRWQGRVAEAAGREGSGGSETVIAKGVAQ